jgi:hypothetical protein
VVKPLSSKRETSSLVGLVVSLVVGLLVGLLLNTPLPKDTSCAILF